MRVAERSCYESVRVQHRYDPEIDSDRRLQLCEAFCDRDSGSFVAVDAPNDEHLCSGGIAHLERVNRPSLHRMTDEVLYDGAGESVTTNHQADNRYHGESEP